MSVFLIPAANPSPLTGAGNNTWLLDGAEPALIDAGVGAAAHVDAIAAALGGRPLAKVLVTHGHSDHASGVPALRARWPNLEAWKWSDERDDGAATDLPWRPLRHGQHILAGDATLTVIHTPGHAIDHVCFWDAETRSLFAGDMVVRGTTIMIPGNRGGGLRAYLSSLRAIAALEPARIYPGHGPIIDHPLELIEQYLEHRQMREDQVRACLADGLSTAPDIVSRLYPGLAEPLVRAAQATIEAHLEKLREDGL